jgi:dTDP-4-dehydrorhamnose reductase
MSPAFFVTGSSCGLGRHIARQALAAGHRVTATARTPDVLDELGGRYGKRVHLERLDVADPAAVERAVVNGVTAFGRLDVVINCRRSSSSVAGIAACSSALATKSCRWLTGFAGGACRVSEVDQLEVAAEEKLQRRGQHFGVTVELFSPGVSDLVDVSVGAGGGLSPV